MITITEKRGSIITAPDKDRRTLVLLTNSTMTSSSSNYRDYISRYPFTKEELDTIKKTGANDAILLNPEIAPYKRVVILKIDKKAGEFGCKNTINRMFDLLAYYSLFDLMMPRLGNECEMSWDLFKNSLLKDPNTKKYDFDIIVYYPR